MKLKASPTLIGSFVLGAIVLGGAALLSFGGRNPLAPRRRLVVYFDESVAGLDPGAAVKVRGVQRGRVLSLVPTLSPDSRAAVVAVICEMAGSELSRAGGATVDLSDPGVLKTLVAEGLRARLKPAGLSGEYNVDLDFYDPSRYPVPAAPDWMEGAQPYPSVPAIPSAAGELLDNLQAVMGQLRKTDFEGLVQKLSVAAVSVNELTGADVRKTVRQVGDAAGSIKDLSGADAPKTLRQIGDAALSVKELADYLERNPNAIISGKKPPAKP